MSDATLWTITDIAGYLNMSIRHVQDRIVNQPNFPRPIRIPTMQGRANPRWKKHEVIEWVESYQERKVA